MRQSSFNTTESPKGISTVRVQVMATLSHKPYVVQVVAFVSILLMLCVGWFLPDSAMFFLVGVTIAAAIAINPNWLIYLAVILAIITIPAQVSLVVDLGGFKFRAYEFFLFGSSVFVAYKYPANRFATSRVYVLVAALVCWSVFGFSTGNDIGRVVGDVRHILYMALAIFVASRIAGTPVMDGIVKLLPFVLWISAGVTVVGSIYGIALSGREFEIGQSAAVGEATRLLTPATYPALAVICAVVALALSGRYSISSTWIFSVPALVIVFLSFSRNNIIALVASIVFAIASIGLTKVAPMAFKYIIYGTLGILAFLLLEPVLLSWSFGEWLVAQLHAYNVRVISGITAESLDSDGSALYRSVQENPYLLRGIAESPLVGHGFGYPYKPLITGRSYFSGSESLRYYAHNFYYWITVKAGILGLAAFFYSVVWPVVSSIRARQTDSLAAGAAATGLLACSIVAPMPLGAPTAVLLGALVGICCVRNPVHAIDKTDKGIAHV
jgi:hypothetical protein